MNHRTWLPMRFFLILLLASSLSGATSPPEIAGQARQELIEVKMLRIDLDERRPERRGFGNLKLLSAVRLQSKDPRFGGFSGLSFGSDGRLYAVSDRGYWISAGISVDANGVLSQLRDWQLAPLRTITKAAVSGRLRDAEALAQTQDGSFLVAFEGAHRVWRYAAPPETLASAPTPVETPAAIMSAPSNAGVEALTELSDGRLVLLTEGFKNSDGSVKAWLRGNGRWAEFSYRPESGFYVTDCAALPDGGLLVLERRFAFFAILSTRVTVLPAAAVQRGAKLVGRELLRLEQPLNVENFEGIAVRQSPQGMAIFMISDDNYSSFQQTLLLQFLLPAPDTLTIPAAP